MELRRRREESGFTQVELGARVFVSGGYIGEFEQAIRKRRRIGRGPADRRYTPNRRYFRATVQEADRRLLVCGLLRQAAELETLATKICEFAPALIPGLLQTPAYARAVTLAMNPFAPEESVDEKVSGRIERGRLLKDATRPVSWAILHENVLRIPVGGPGVMAEQLENVAELARERSVLVQVLPYTNWAVRRHDRLTQAHGVRGRSTNRLYRSRVFGDPVRPSGRGTTSSIGRRSAEGGCTATGGFPDPHRIRGGGPQTMREYDLSKARWRKSSHSDGNGGDCVEVAYDFPTPPAGARARTAAATAERHASRSATESPASSPSGTAK
ncbi:hypothetical protein SHIRM173S_12846 [Streptomyces hirsutus]